MGRLVHYSKKYNRQNETVVSLFKKQLTKTPDRAIYLFEDQVWTMRDVIYLITLRYWFYALNVTLY